MRSLAERGAEKPMEMEFGKTSLACGLLEQNTGLIFGGQEIASATEAAEGVVVEKGRHREIILLFGRVILSRSIGALGVMDRVWITTAEVGVEPGDMPSGETLGFMKITMWASSHEDFSRKLKAYLAKYKWTLLSMERTELVDPSLDYGDEANQMIDETLGDQNAIRLGTYYSYKPD
jgi:ribosomal protein L10